MATTRLPTLWSGAVYLAVQILAVLWLVVVPIVAALLIAALLRPVAALLQHRMRGTLSAALTLLAAILVLGGIAFVIGLRFTQQLPMLIDEALTTMRNVGDQLSRIGIGQTRIAQLQSQIMEWVQANRGQIISYVTTGAGYLAEFATVLVLTLFITFFLLYDGERIWALAAQPAAAVDAREDGPGRPRRLDHPHPVRARHGGHRHDPRHRDRARAVPPGGAAGRPAGRAGVPGQLHPDHRRADRRWLAVLVTFGTQGWMAALSLLGVLVLENRLEGHCSNR
ncbi:AI-2E family transporter [Pseudonocardia asaccharolytica]|uniref:AI-2E family transporter n=1 Tax=Pseudonocardia asaccharolytica DSM 44247 = NBRC 16224 TaxID=1123024 RepID=A0A511CYJ1_9PSEU|nr:AI-2E family transporter [Pseudonocardia asaccharolytica]GEL17323.1 hypothetical protein PA7_11600 [Pseudonocardia asaccharolytica DSM 44247 = NBRC 16224]